jgi:two-component system alkaline phosphatase synthesis response regulator PhoP
MIAKVLVCDDEIHIVRAVQFKLSRAGYEVRCAADGQQAWQEIERDLPDLVITDYQMPNMNGLALIECIRECPQTRDLPVIMLSAKGFELSLQELADRWGVLQVMDKPFSPRQLLRLVESALMRRPALTETR